MVDPNRWDLESVLDALDEDQSPQYVRQERAQIIGGRYEIVEELGAGAMGRVLLVRHERLGKPFALKLMSWFVPAWKSCA